MHTYIHTYIHTYMYINSMRHCPHIWGFCMSVCGECIHVTMCVCVVNVCMYACLVASEVYFPCVLLCVRLAYEYACCTCAFAPAGYSYAYAWLCMRLVCHHV